MPILSHVLVTGIGCRVGADLSNFLLDLWHVSQCLTYSEVRIRNLCQVKYLSSRLIVHLSDLKYLSLPVLPDLTVQPNYGTSCNPRLYTPASGGGLHNLKVYFTSFPWSDHTHLGHTGCDRVIANMHVCFAYIYHSQNVSYFALPISQHPY